MKKRLIFHLLFTISCCFLLVGFQGCGDQKAQDIVDAGIEVHGGNAFRSFILEFDFRNRHYTAARDGGIFCYTRAFTDSTGEIKDVLDNSGFTRYHNGSVVDLSPNRKAAFTRSVNSVVYFALLPFGLNDDAVNKRWVGETTIDDEPYDIIRVTFDQSGGGEDHQDVFLYWFHRNKNTMDYLAYSYQTDGGGLRFRKAVNPRKENGILLQDYINYKPANEALPIEALQAMFVDGELEKLSEIRLEKVKVSSYREDHCSGK